MKHISIYSFILIISFLNSFSLIAQTPGIKWQKYYPERPWDLGQIIYQVKPTSDGGYIFVGCDTVFRPNNNSTLDKESSESPWIVKTDKDGNIIWSRKSDFSETQSFYSSVAQTHSNDFITAGHGYKYNYSNSTYIEDLIVVKYKKDGSHLWQKSYGGSNTETAQSIAATKDGGYAVAGYTNSNNGQVSGNHGTNTFDFWILKIDSVGIVQWQKTLGGSGDEKAYSIQQTTDGGYIVAGKDSSANGDVTVHKGSSDGWVVKLSNTGTIEWQKSLGGTGKDVFKSVTQTADGGYMVTGYTFSNDGDVSGNHGNADVWVVKIDYRGELVWQKCFGGTNEEFGASLERTIDNAYIIGGHTLSNNGDVSGLNGGSDAWLFKIDNNANLLWQKTIGSTKNEYGMSAIALTENDFAIAGFGDTRTNEQYQFEAGDGILTRLGNTNTITGYVFLDNNLNGIKEINEPFFSDVLVNAKKPGYLKSAVPYNGSFKIDVDTGTYSTTAVVNNPYFNASPATKSSSFTTYFNTDSVNFAVQPIAGKKDLSVDMVPITPARPGFAVQYKIFYQNKGTETIATGNIEFIKSSMLNFNSAFPASTSVNGDTLRWNFSNLKPLDTAGILLNFTVKAPPTVNNGDVIILKATINPVTSDLTTKDNVSELKQVVIGSFDPNDKTEAHAGVLTQEQLTSGENLVYTIRFQNTGTDTAFNISVRDTLSNKVDWSTLQMISTSHNYQLSINDGNKCTWFFDNILLPDSTTNERASHGYITFRIKPAVSLAPGDTVKNSASIYYDYNLPVQTNTERTIARSAVLPVKLFLFEARRSGGENVLHWRIASDVNTSHFEIYKSADGVNFSLLNKKLYSETLNYYFTDAKPFDVLNYYRLKIINKDGSGFYSSIIVIRNKMTLDVAIYPNPVLDNVNLHFNNEKKTHVQLEIVNIEGKVLQSHKLLVTAGLSTKNLDVSNLSRGTYFVRIVSESEQLGMKFLKTDND
ncbi:MAG TPA: T9SS type A sorting domain-containing protein [Segetibacter sp.]